MDRSADLGFAAGHDIPIAYLARVREYYQALGYGAPYEWAHYAEVPWHRSPGRCRRAASRSSRPAAPYQPDAGDQGPGAPYNARAKFFSVYSRDARRDDHDLRISHVAIDRQHTTATDSGTWFPLAALRRAEAAGTIGAIAPRFHGAPTNRSHRTTLAVDAPEIVARCRADAVDAAVLVANCPVCHQTLALVARALEASGIASVVMGCAKDIVEHVGVPRFVFSDFPLGNAAGRPHDVASQDETLALALALLEAAPAARTTVQSPLRWSDSAEWKLDYCNIARLSARRDRAATRGVRCRQGGGEVDPRGRAVRTRRVPVRRRRVVARKATIAAVVVAMISLLGAATAQAPLAPSASVDPLESPECRRALSALNAEESAVAEARASERRRHERRPAPHRRAAGAGAATGRDGVPRAPRRSGPARRAAAGASAAGRRAAACGRAASTPAPVAPSLRAAPPTPLAAERPYAITSCDAGGCWATTARA
jgi:hypothetical protein